MPKFNPHYVLAAMLDPSQAFMVEIENDYISKLLLECLDPDDTSDAASEADSDVPEEATFEELMLKKRKLEKPLSSQGQGSTSGSGTTGRNAKEVVHGKFGKKTSSSVFR